MRSSRGGLPASVSIAAEKQERHTPYASMTEARAVALLRLPFALGPAASDSCESSGRSRAGARRPYLKFACLALGVCSPVPPSFPLIRSYF